MPLLNVEIKAICRDLQKTRNRLLELNPRYVGEDHQVDTYFRVPNGRLKLREGNIENHLIQYFRSDITGPKKSEVRLFPTEPGSPLKEILTDALGVLAVVDKKRSIYFVDNVKIHLDEVEGLGDFLEIEAIDETGTISADQLHTQCRHFMGHLEISEEDLIDVSYCDLIIQKSA